MSSNGPGEWSFLRGMRPAVQDRGAGGTLLSCLGATTLSVVGMQP